jgi:hypothetical protein
VAGGSSVGWCRPTPAAAVPVGSVYQGRGRPPTPRYPDKPVSLKALVLAADRGQIRTVGWREGDRGPLAGQFIAIRVRPANDAQRQDDGVLPERWLLAEWPEGKAEPVKYWLSNLPADTPLHTLVLLAKLRWRVEHDYRELTQCLGLDHYEGRTYRGLHHHLTCVPRRPRVPDLLAAGPRRPRRRPPSDGGSLITLYQAQRRPPDRPGLLARAMPDPPAQAAAITT